VFYLLLFLVLSYIFEGHTLSLKVIFKGFTILRIFFPILIE